MKKVDINQLDFQKMGELIPAIVQDEQSKDVLMLGYMNEAALENTLRTKKVMFWSRSKKRLWEKGETSGNSLEVVSIISDCDSDSLLITARPKGPVCHTGQYSCFGSQQKVNNLAFLQQLYHLIIERKKNLPENSYTAFLFKKGLGKILEKVEEESKEVVFAAQKETQNRLIEESADLLYHLFVLLIEKDISLGDIVKELERRNR